MQDYNKVISPLTSWPNWLAFYGSELACLLAGWRYWMQAGSIPCDQKFTCKWKKMFFKAVTSNSLAVHLVSTLHIISSLFIHFKSWDYPENFGIYSQLVRKIKAWPFTFFNAYFSWIERDKIFMSQLSIRKFRYFAE